MEMLKETIGEENTSVQMYENGSYDEKPYTVRMVDLDVNETVCCVICPSLEIAEKKFNEMVG